MASLLRARYPFIPPSVTVDHIVIGGGVVGLAIAEKLVQAFDGRTTFVLERNAQIGQETSSRNSEVIHSGIYYPIGSLKTNLCIRGRKLLYERCERDGIPHRKTGKLIVATSDSQLEYLHRLTSKGKELDVPLERLSGKQAREMEPDIGDNVVGALFSPETGIVSSHSLMEHLEQSILDSETGEMVMGTLAVRIDKDNGSSGKRGDGSDDGWIVQAVTGGGSGGEGERTSVKAKVVVNASGLSSQHILNQILPEDKQQDQFYAKGSYFQYRGPGVSSVRHLIYPCPDPKSLAGLGTHLTMNLAGEIRFGPDVQWIPTPKEVKSMDDLDYWKSQVGASEENLEKAVEAVQNYLPGVDPDGFSPDYAGIRPKITRAGEAARDFSIEHVAPGFISLLGIESPGLTSSLAIAERVESIIRNDVWGLGRSRGKRVSEGGGSGGEGWA